MGLYPIDCSQCKKPFMWFSGNLDSRCSDCIKKSGEQTDEWLDQMDKKLNQTPLACGHKPCTLGGCKSCGQHCGKGKQK